MSANFGTLQSNAFGDRYFPQINGSMFARQSSEVLYRQYFPEWLEKEDHLFIIMGSDSGLVYQFLMSQTLPEHTHYVIIDFPQAIAHLDLPDSALRIENEREVPQVLVVDDQFDLNQLAVVFMPYLIRQTVELVRSFGVQDAEQGGDYHRLRKHFEGAYSTLLKQELIALNMKPFIDAQLNNMVDNLRPMAEMRNRLEGATALILGGGPTLDSAIDWIKSNQEKVVIFSAARIARRLLKEGITPDIFVSVDPHDVSFDNSKGIFAFSDRSLLINSHHINPKILGQWPGVSAYLADQTPWQSAQAENIGAPGPNVINTALHVAFELGCSTFIFSGVDMCFVGKQAFESGSDEAKSGGKFVFNEIQTVENNAGEIAQTQPMYSLGRQMIESQVRGYLQQKPALQFITLGLNSAKMENVRYIAPEELGLEGRSIQFDIEAMIDALSLDREARQKAVGSVVMQMKEQVKRFHSLRQDAKSALQLVDKMYDRNGQENAAMVKKFLKLKKVVDKGIGADGDMLFNYENRAFATNFKSIGDESSMGQNEVQEQLHAFYSGVAEGADLFHQALLKALGIAELRLDELNGRHLADCETKWQELQQPGRALLWQQWHPDGNTAAIVRNVEAFNQMVENTQTVQLAQLKEKSENLPSLFNRALEAFEDREPAEIEEILQHLQALTPREGLQDLTLFCQALSKEMQADYEAALEDYRAIEYAAIRHQALKRALSVSMQLQHNQLSLQLLEQLCHYSLDYMLPYANLLDLLGQKGFAAEVLNMYLQQKPENDAARIQLAQKWIELQQMDQAKQQLQLVLSRHPEHKTALQLLSML
ncbi:6-hydroxymethylpterin diphosphokinase MptE-like protein [Thiomicrorhabdus sp.]|uniref:6-hydroxymethylpterin diphosphokinase MptE-like protein n=1 Tax=Thiomicrorhabdus sp. TaxID=2039724 RepID=UPI0029C94908|nr:6-hydroxymethylpterin diphosphokinase MptE-like protein [Thiomicrorhabdus sp.]